MPPAKSNAIENEPIMVLVLGQMQQRDRGAIASESRTANIKSILEQIAVTIEEEPSLKGQKFKIISPEDRSAHVVIPGILDLIETTELVIIDMSGSRANVGYEAGIVHALGLPYIIITSDDLPPFYFQGTECIANFHFTKSYDSSQATHEDLRRHLVQFAVGTDSSAAYSDNQLTKYYELPIVDVAGPSGLAAGYYRNGVRRFVRPGGFMDAPCEVTWTTGFTSRDGVETRHVHRCAMDISHMIAVRPNGGLTHSYSEHTKKLDEELEKLGLRLQFATIPKREKEFEDMRDFGGQFLVRIGKPGDAVTFVEPGIVVDTPTTLYALQFSPRVRRLNRLSGTPLQPSLEVRRKRLLDRMQASFERNLYYQLEQEMDPARIRRFRNIDLNELPDVLREIGVSK